MPILAAEPAVYPANLFDHCDPYRPLEDKWWVVHCLPRQEKQLIRRLRKMDVAHFCPMISKRNRSTGGRVRTSYVPLFPGYAFVNGGNSARLAAVSTGCVSRYLVVSDDDELRGDLAKIHQLVSSGVPLTQEARLLPGDRVRVLSGALMNLEGNVLRRQGELRLLVAVKFMQQGASVLLEDCQLEKI